jgi:hypothetical protein
MWSATTGVPPTIVAVPRGRLRRRCADVQPTSAFPGATPLAPCWPEITGEGAKVPTAGTLEPGSAQTEPCGSRLPAGAATRELPPPTP